MKMNNSQLKISPIISIGIWVLLLSAPINNLIDVLSMLFSGTKAEAIHDVIRNVTIFFVGTLLVGIFKKQATIMLGSLFFFGVLWYRSAAGHPNLIPFLEENSVPFFIECLPYLWIFNYLIKTDRQQSGFYAYSYLFKIYKIKLVLALIAQFIMFVFPATDIFHDYMNAANAILVGLLFVTIDNLRTSHHNKRNFILEIASVLSILLLGSRGGIMCYISNYFFYFVLISKGARKRKGILLGFFLFFLLLIILPIITSSWGDNRLVNLFSSGRLFYDEERQLISGIMIANIIQNPWGMGVMADRDLLTNSNEVWSVFYAHNFFLEMGIDFGYIGILIALVFVVGVIRLLIIAQDNYKCIINVLLCSSVVKLMVSASFWTDSIIWALLGVVLAIPFRHDKPSNQKAE